MLRAAHAGRQVSSSRVATSRRRKRTCRAAAAEAAPWAAAESCPPARGALCAAQAAPQPARQRRMAKSNWCAQGAWPAMGRPRRRRAAQTRMPRTARCASASRARAASSWRLGGGECGARQSQRTEAQVRGARSRNAAARNAACALAGSARQPAAGRQRGVRARTCAAAASPRRRCAGFAAGRSASPPLSHRGPACVAFTWNAELKGSASIVCLSRTKSVVGRSAFRCPC